MEGTGGQPSRARQRSRAVLLLLVRGVLLWFVVPLALAVWLVVAVPLKRRGVTVGQFLGWVDLNLIAGIQRTVLRPLWPHPLAWVSARALSDVTHRIQWNELA